MLINKKKKSVIWIAPAKKKVVIPNGTKVIGDYCFYGSKAESLVISKSVKKIGKKALEASDLEKIRLKKGNKVYAKCTDPQMLDQKSNDWRSIFLWLNIVLNLKRK